MLAKPAEMVAFREFERFPYIVTVCSRTVQALSMFTETNRMPLESVIDEYPFAVYVDDLEITPGLAKLANTHRLPFEAFTSISRKDSELWSWSIYHSSAFGSGLVSSGEVRDFSESLGRQFTETRLLPYSEFPEGYLEVVGQLLSRRARNMS